MTLTPSPPSSEHGASPASGTGIAGLLATVFGIGRLPIAPGTWGSLAALPPAYAILDWGGPENGAAALTGAAVIVFLVGVFASDIYVKRTGRGDPGEVVIDEVAGQWVALVLAGTDLLLFGLGFLLFRIFDIWKPWPAGWADRTIKGGLGVMLDDIFAGLYAGALVFAVKLWME